MGHDVTQVCSRTDHASHRSRASSCDDWKVHALDLTCFVAELAELQDVEFVVVS